MKHCPNCNKQFTENWITFCSEDGTMLIEDLTPPRDPYWDPQIKNPRVETQSASEQPTMWLPQQPPGGGWIAPDQRPPAQPQPAWQPPPAPFVKPASQGLAVASMIIGILGLFAGWICFGPLPGIVALVLGLVALSQIKKAPERVTGKPFAVVGVITGSMTLFFYGLMFVWILVSSMISN